MGRAPHGGPLSYLCQSTLSVRAAQMSGLVSIPSLPLPSSQRGVFATLSLERGQEPRQTLVSFCCLAWVFPSWGRHRRLVLSGCPSPGTGTALTVRAGGAAGAHVVEGTPVRECPVRLGNKLRGQHAAACC